jgi:hypothetical protein
MKTKIALFIATFAASALAGFAADRNSEAASRVEVNFQNPENFTDVKDSFTGTDRGRDAYLEMFRDYLQKNASRRLADGQKLSITFTDIDLAGDFEPQRGPSAQDVRIIKSIYVPRLKFDFRLTDASGNVVKEGKASLTDLNFQHSVSPVFASSDELRYEKRMLDDWMSNELGKPQRK